MILGLELRAAGLADFACVAAPRVATRSTHHDHFLAKLDRQTAFSADCGCLLVEAGTGNGSESVRNLTGRG